MTNEHKGNLESSTLYKDANLKVNFVQVLVGKKTENYSELFYEKSNPGKGEFAMETPKVELKLEEGVSFNFLCS